MNFFKLHIGDYDSATAHLSWDEDAAYQRLMRAYYRREQPIPDAEKYRLCRATGRAQRAGVDAVLGEFFTRDGDVWRNKRCDEEIMAYQSQAETNRRIATNRPTNRKRTVRDPSDGSSYEALHDPSTIGSPNHKPLTTNHEPEVLSTNSASSNASTRADELRRALQENNLNPEGIALADWVNRGVTPQRLREVIGKARRHKPAPENIPHSYLNKILDDGGNGLNGHEKPWFIRSKTAIEAKGEELGITPGEDEEFPYFKIRVLTAAGVSEDMVRKAEADYR